MLKGVNKLIVEINNPESEYFERAIFFIKPSKRDIPTIDLSDNAGNLIKNAASQINKKQFRHSSLFKLLGAAGTGALIAGFILKFI